ncbi:hypothetical protein FN976_18675 [Caenimonas sedimenti]|uniref:VCBS repeat-containing protein n=1 Tax=Caenimonas sedimenti TaxID=2596921 RepID=A0A562ZN96_9BURK|nr:hypothetical protein [Caenimonas sedimenti]TWO69841.1 hypothetical protein FN976_18675 [Caenimonas sedimenti]
MNTAKNTTLRALRDFGLVSAISLAAASIWAAGLPEEGYLLDAEMWQEEVAASPDSQWPAEGWFRLVPQGRGIEVSAAQRGQPGAPAADALYFRLPGTQLKQGLRAVYAGTVLQQPRLGQDYELTLGQGRFGLRVESGVKGMEYAITYGQQTYTYVLGPFDATKTSVKAVADLDGDARPDFLIDVGDDATYLLLSTKARPGANLPTAELWAKGC